MIHLESFSKFREEKLKPLTDKYGKSGYLSVSTNKKLKDLGIEPEQFKSLEKRVIDCTKMIEADNTYLLDMLLLDLDDFLDTRGFRCERFDFNEQNGLSSAKPELKVNFGSTPIFYDSKTFEQPIRQTPIDTLFEIITKINGLKGDIIKKRIEDQDNHWFLKRGQRDWGTMTKFKKGNPYEKITINPIFKLQLKIYWGNLDEEQYWYDDDITMADRDNMRQRRKDILDEVEKFLKEDTFYRYFHLIGFKNLKFKIVTNNYWYSQSRPYYSIEVEL